MISLNFACTVLIFVLSPIENKLAIYSDVLNDTNNFFWHSTLFTNYLDRSKISMNQLSWYYKHWLLFKFWSVIGYCS